MLTQITHNNIGTLSEKFSSFLEANILSLQEKEYITIWLSGGNSLLPFYEECKKLFLAFPENIRAKIRFVFLDERVVPLSSLESNFHTVYQAFLSQLVEGWYYKTSQIIAIDLEVQDIALEYTSQVGTIDIALFGAWEDGHIGSLFPRHPLLLSKSHWYIEIIDSPKPPPRRITISPRMIQVMEYVYIFFIWTTKRIAYEAFLDPTRDYVSCPARLLHNTKALYVFSNQEVQRIPL